METLAKQFDDALTLIGLGDKGERARKAHEEVRKVLEESQKLREWGVDTILIGSYARDTGIYPGKDVDVFTKLARLDTSTSPTSVFEAVRDVLLNKYGNRATPQRRSIKIRFGDEFSVDVVPAVRSVKRWAIPNRDPAQWGQPDTRWRETDPERFGVLTTERNKKPTVSGRGAYVSVVKLIRQVREHHLGDAKPGGLYLELATYAVFMQDLAGDNFAELLATTLRRIINILGEATRAPLIDPALGTAYAPAPTAIELQAAQANFAHLAEDAERALELDRCEAAVLWRHILGRNARGSCFPLPPGCDESGRAITAVTANIGRGSDEARPFA